jgi:hypothetical protein
MIRSAMQKGGWILIKKRVLPGLAVVGIAPLVATVGLIAILGLNPQFATRVAAQEQLPIIDLHFHPQPQWNRGALVNLFDQLGVAMAGNGPGGPDSVALSFAQQYPGRFIPFAGLREITDIIHTDGDHAWNLNGGGITSYLIRLEAELASGQYKGIGELFPNNLHSTSRGFPSQRYPVDAPLMRHLWALSAKYGVPLSVHLEADMGSVAEMERLLGTTPQGTFIWAHTGFFAEPSLLSRLLTQHADLYCELSWRDERPVEQGWRLPLPISEGGHLRSAWKDLLEEFPDRFVIGTDAGDQGSVTTYARLINYWRTILSQLAPATAQKLAHQNAEHILKLPPSVKR